MEITAQKKFLDRLSDGIKSFAVLIIILLGSILLLRLVELVSNYTAGSTASNKVRLYGAAISYDLLFWLRFSLTLLVIYLPLFFLSRKLSYLVFVLIASFYFILQLSLLQYFSQALVPLGADIYSYSKADITHTIAASANVSHTTVATSMSLLSCCLFAFYFCPRKIAFGKKSSFSLLLLLIVTFSFSSYFPLPTRQGTEFLGNLALNKTEYFLSASITHFLPEDDETDIYSDAYIGEAADGPGSIAPFEYIDAAHYPFLRRDNSPDVLSSFFNRGSKPPNIVILLVEGLGRAFTNEGAYLGNFTPYLDSLSAHSLYWENFLSEGGRTFAVLPSVIGSLPFSNKGFADMGDKMPDHLSLVSLLKLNGYHTSFYYGGDSRFDNMQLFLKRNGIDAINDEKSFGKGYAKMPENSGGFSWGYGDQELFRKYFDTREAEPAKPSLDIILTVSTHTPFLINNQQQYLEKFEARMKQLDFDELKKSEYRDYKFQYASILFADDAIKSFIANFSKRADFNNTIFFITGDHRMPEIPMTTAIDRYHVPLIIYSPLLARSAKFSSISTHFDITPSILAFLKSNYSVKLPGLVTWVGSGLDTSRSLVNSHAYPLLQTKSDLVDFISGENLLHNQQLLKVSHGLRLAEIEDEAKAATVQHSFAEFKKKNESISKGAALLPDSIYLNYFPR
jgi:uncharacterized sulfatase